MVTQALLDEKSLLIPHGGFAPHGGGAFSGKDPTKVDVSPYMARWLAKNVVADNMADWCQIQLSYAIGVKEPTSIYVDSNGHNRSIQQFIENEIDLTPQVLFDALICITFMDIVKTVYMVILVTKNVLGTDWMESMKLDVHDYLTNWKDKREHLLVDLRSYEIRENDGNVLRAMVTSYNEIYDNTDMIPTYVDCVGLCKDGSISSDLVMKLEEKGFTNLYWIDGGADSLFSFR